jgi:predicted transcriptional regulator
MSVRLDPDVKVVLQIIAEAEERSVSWITNRVLRQWAREHAAEIEAARRGLAKSKS